MLVPQFQKLPADLPPSGLGYRLLQEILRPHFQYDRIHDPHAAHRYDGGVEDLVVRDDLPRTCQAGHQLPQFASVDNRPRATALDEELGAAGPYEMDSWTMSGKGRRRLFMDTRHPCTSPIWAINRVVTRPAGLGLALMPWT